MPDPAEKSDDLIAELAKLMATPAPQSAAAPVSVPPLPQRTFSPEPAPPIAADPGPSMVRIPGMDAPRPAPAPEPPRAPVTGVIRIPGMNQPAPVSTSAPVGKLDFGNLNAPAAPEPQSPPQPGPEPLSSLADRIAARAAESDARIKAPSVPPPATAPIKFPELRTVSENKSFAQGPAITIPPARPTTPAPAAPASNEFTFDFGFSSPSASLAPASKPAAPAADPIAALINADLAAHPMPQEPRQAPPVIPVLRTAAPPQKAPPPPPMAPIAPAQRQTSSAPIPLRPINPPRTTPEADRFAVAPDDGLNLRFPTSRPLGTPAQRAPEPAPLHVETDPMAEIESLIGEAVRVELSPGPVRVQAAQPMTMRAEPVAPRVQMEPEAAVEQEIHAVPAPVVPPLSTQFAPRRSAIRDDSHAAAEDAILQAAAASGAEVDRIEPPAGDDSPYRRLKVKPQRSAYASSGLRQYVGMAVAGTLLLAAGLGLYWVLNMGRPTSSGTNAPQLTASTAQVKDVPKPAAKPVTDVAKSPVLQQMAGASTAPSSEQLVTTDQTVGATPAAPQQVATADDGSGDTSEGGLANRKVRTVTVRPDGSIVSGDDAVAGNSALPVERPNVPTVPSSETTDLLGTDMQVATADASAASTGTGTKPLIPMADIPDAPSSAAADVQPVMDPTIVAPVPMSFPIRQVGATPASTPAPKNPVNAVVTGAQTPDGQINLLGADALAPHKTVVPARVAAATPAAAPVAAAAYVQLTSSPSAADANSAVRTATARYGSLFGGSKLMVVPADLGAKGTWYRVRLPVASAAEAQSICSQIKAQGGECIVTGG